MTDTALSGVLANLTPWRDEHLERDVALFLENPADAEQAKALRDRILDEIQTVLPAVRAELADIEAEWSRERSGRFLHAGLAEIKAERFAIFEYQQLMNRAMGVTRRVIAEHNRRDYEANTRPRQQAVIDAAIVLSREQEWDRDSTSGRALLAAVRNLKRTGDGK